MSRHQVIYTSCMRGIGGVNDGQQIYSYDAGFKDVQSDEIKGLFTYQIPALPAGVAMSEELVPSMPQAFIYRRLKNGMGTITLNTYLGRDYMGAAGRFGNHLSHVVAFDEGEIRRYPCEFYGSDMLRRRMEYAQVNNPEPPECLPVPELTPGYAVDMDAVSEFLGVGDRMSVYKNMLHAFLAFGSARKRVVICDEPANIILWIAALEYALPLKNALTVNFSTYDFDPSLSSSRVCGVVRDGTKYGPDSARQHFVFDLFTGKYPSFDTTGEFDDFIDMAMSLSYDSLRDFHTFLTGGFQYEGADEDFYDAYRLYTLLSDGIGAAGPDMFDRAVAFADTYGREGIHARLARRLLEDREVVLHADRNFASAILTFLMRHYSAFPGDIQAAVRGMTVDRVLMDFCAPDATEAEFRPFFEAVDSLCRAANFSVATELMKENHRDSLLAVLRKPATEWKLSFVVGILCAYVKDNRLSKEELQADGPTGRLFYDIIQSVYSSGTHGFYLVTRILDEFADSVTYLIEMAMDLEGILLDLPEGAAAADTMWKYFYAVVYRHYPENPDQVYAFLASYERDEQMLALYTVFMENAVTAEQAHRLFSDHYGQYIRRIPRYAERFTGPVLEAYYHAISTHRTENIGALEWELFDIIEKQGLSPAFADGLTADLVGPIPMGSPSSANKALIKRLFSYTYTTRRQPIVGKLQLLMMGLMLEDAREYGTFREFSERLAPVLGDSVDITLLTDDERERYFDWIVPCVCDLCKSAKELDAIYNLFRMNRPVATQYMADCARLYLKQGVRGGDYAGFCEFLRFLFPAGDGRLRDGVAQAVGRLSRPKLEAVDDAVAKAFQGDGKALDAWDEIKEAAASAHPLLGFLNKWRKD